MDVVTINTFIDVDNKIVDNETHYIHDEAEQHKQKWKKYFPTSIMQLFFNQHHAKFWLFYWLSSQFLIFIQIYVLIEKWFSVFRPRKFTEKVPIK